MRLVEQVPLERLLVLGRRERLVVVLRAGRRGDLELVDQLLAEFIRLQANN